MNKVTEACPWDFIDLLKVFSFFFFMMLVGSPLQIKLIDSVLGTDAVEYFGLNSIIVFFSMLTNILTCAYVYKIVSVNHKQPLSTLGLNFTNWGKNVFIGFILYMAILPIIIVSGFLVNVIAQQFGITPNQQAITIKMLQESSTSVLTFMLLFGILGAPIVEEFIFRGFLQPAIRCHYGKSYAIIASGFIFALVHLIGDQNVFVFFQIFILGLFLAYIFERTGSLVAPISVHIIHNSITLSYLFVYK